MARSRQSPNNLSSVFPLDKQIDKPVNPSAGSDPCLSALHGAEHALAPDLSQAHSPGSWAILFAGSLKAETRARYLPLADLTPHSQRASRATKSTWFEAAAQDQEIHHLRPKKPPSLPVRHFGDQTLHRRPFSTQSRQRPERSDTLRV